MSAIQHLTSVAPEARIPKGSLALEASPGKRKLVMRGRLSTPRGSVTPEDGIPRGFLALEAPTRERKLVAVEIFGPISSVGNSACISFRSCAQHVPTVHSVWHGMVLHVPRHQPTRQGLPSTPLPLLSTLFAADAHAQTNGMSSQTATEGINLQC